MAETKRVSNFTQPEKLYLINLISKKYWKIVEDKKTNRTSLNEKKDVWKDIERVFNASGPMVVFRNADSLKRLYENKKKELRKKLGEEKKQRQLTGGGTMPSIIFDEIDKILMSILNEKCLTGHEVLYDCDGEQGTPINSHSGDYEFEFLPDNEVQENQSNVEIIGVQNIGVNKEHALQENKLDGVSAETGDAGTPAWKKFKTDNLKQPLNSVLQKSSPIASISAGRSSATPGVTKAPNRRRPMLTRPLTTSDISEKYNLLLDRRMTLLEKQLEQIDENAKFQKEEQKLKLELLNIEIQYKKTLLRNLGSAL